MIYVCEDTRMTAKQMFLYYLQNDNIETKNEQIKEVLSSIFSEIMSALRAKETDVYTVIAEMRDLHRFINKKYPSFEMLASEYMCIYEGFEDAGRLPAEFTDYASEKQIEMANQLLNSFICLLRSDYEIAMITEVNGAKKKKKLHCNSISLRSLAKFFITADECRREQNPFVWTFSDNEDEMIEHAVEGTFFKFLLLGCINGNAVYRFFIANPKTNEQYYSEMSIRDGEVITHFV